MFKPIPTTALPEQYTNIQPTNCKFINIINDDMLDVKMQYPLQNLKCAVKDCYIRLDIYEKLLTAQALLPDGYKLRIWDAWRPFTLQQELYEKYYKDIVNTFDLSKLPLHKQQSIVSNYISYPEDNRMYPPLHTTGGAVDVTLLDLYNNEVEMGTAFDDFSPKARTDYFEENPIDIKLRKNRRILYNCMTRAGFVNLPSEWWHYSYGDRVWAYYNSTPALYSGVYSTEELINKNDTADL